MASTLISWLLDKISQHPFYVLISVVTAYFTVNRLNDYYRLRHIPGPPTTGISWLWHSRAVISGNSHIYYGNATEKYGPIARVAPNHLITSSPDLWSQINAVRSPYKRAEWYYHAARFEPGKDNVFTECNSERHDTRRKKMAAGYAGKENPGLECTIDVQVTSLIHLIREKYAAPAASTGVSKPMDLAKKIAYLTLDVISAVGLGKPFGDLKADADVNDYLHASETGLHIGNMAFGLGTSWLTALPIIGPAISPSEKDTTGFGKMMAEARKVVDQRKMKSTNEKSDMLASFIRHGITGDDLFQEVFEQILAGSDTTAASLRIIMLYIMSHPRVYAKLQREIDDAVAGQAVGEDIVPDAEARKLPYLSAVIREGLRVHPPVVNLFSRIVPKGGDVVTVDGKETFLPGDTMIGYSAWSMHRNNKAVYGKDAEVFRPERWIVDESVPGEKERLTKMTKTNDLIFGHGRWVCLGKVVAMIEIYKTIFELLRHFDFALTNPHEPWTIFNTMGLFAIGNMWVDVTERK